MPPTPRYSSQPQTETLQVSGRPLTKSEVPDVFVQTVPTWVFDIFNRMIAQNMDGGGAVIKARDVSQAIRDAAEAHGVTFNSKWLNVEAAYRKQGWKVEYDAPGFNETYEAIFTFR